MKSLTLSSLTQDKVQFERMLKEQQQAQVTAQQAILRIEGALLYINKVIELIDKEKKDATASRESNTKK
jgi:hypothetical protein